MFNFPFFKIRLFVLILAFVAFFMLLGMCKNIHADVVFVISGAFYE